MNAKLILTLILLVVLCIILSIITSGCSSTSLTRNPETGELDVKHTTVLIKTKAPTVSVERFGDDGYKAFYNSEARGSDTDIQAMRDILLMVRGGIPHDNEEN